MLPAKICLAQETLDFQALVDSGAEQSFLDIHLVSQLKIPIEPLPTPIPVFALKGMIIAQETHPMHLIISGNHHENIQFFVFEAPNTPIVLDWSTGKLTEPEPPNLSSVPFEYPDLAEVFSKNHALVFPT